jgi:hypothetical protein
MTSEPRITSHGITEALRRKYCGDKLDGTQWVCIPEARSGAGFDGNEGQCDLLAINTWQGRGMELIGHEIKVSMSDWRRELERPEKAERFAKHCRRWFVAAPSKIASKIRAELPAAWGLLSISDAGRITTLVAAPAREDTTPVPDWWWIGWLAQTDRVNKAAVQRDVSRALLVEREAAADSREMEIERRVQARLSASEDARKRLDRLSEAVGVDLTRHWINGHQLKKALAIADHVPPGLPKMLAEASEALALALAEEVPE